ncbi:MAG: FAD-dependent oxidoreductase [Deltaproteobacteria bacterium]|jgi:NADPH-dependent 2,4-dienoyl-CoA reductase/sulfur reductase-like enzyme/peroxiredoxin family protein/rhodanese-related sulfurtransferase/TusA-related sulfurtransferase|nr:FAD-dependent oxidoreductase [Deltaproteobacteria bacterium]
MKILIIGGVAGGATAAARLRRLDESAQITIFERTEYISYANCGLPYYIGGEIQKKEALTLQTPESFRKRYNVDVRVLSQVTSVDPALKTITVTDLANGQTYRENYDKLIMSPGAAPMKPAIEGIDSPRVFTLRNVGDTFAIKDFIERESPKSAVILGGGAIGIEMAENLHRNGLKVTVVELLDQIIAPIDFDMACVAQKYLRSQGVEIILGNAVKSVDDTAKALKIVLNDREMTADMLLLSAGIRPESELAKECGLTVNQRGFIVTDDHLRASDPDIFAIGDAAEITEFVSQTKAAIALAGPANKQGRIAADNVCGLSSVYEGTQGSSILKAFDMTIASTGLNEKIAKRLNINVAKSFTVSPSHAGYYPGANNMIVKTLFDPDTGKLLGAQLIGFDGVDKRCDVIATAIRFGATGYDLAKLELCYAPPYSSAKDPVNIAGFVIENILTEKVKTFHWHDIDALEPDKVTLLDVRTPLEFSTGSIEGFKNIDLDELRNRIADLDRNKPIYVTCQVGLRGYVACRLLSHYGFEAYNLSGGYLIWSEVKAGSAKSLTPPESAPEKACPQNSPGRGDGRDCAQARSDQARDQTEPKTITVNACGLQCPGPIMKLANELEKAQPGDRIEIETTDPAFATDAQAYCGSTGHTFIGTRPGAQKCGSISTIQKCAEAVEAKPSLGGNGKNFIVFSSDLDKAIAAFIMANSSAAMGRKTSMFFTFWGLNILRRSEKVKTEKNFISSMFSMAMPRGSRKLGLSKMNFAGLGAKMIRGLMKSKNVQSLEEMIKQAMDNGVEIVACSMSMDIMGLTIDELIDGVKLSGAAYMLSHAEESDMSLFI